MVQFPRVDRVVLDRVSGPDHLRILKTRNRRDHRSLHIDRHAGRHPVDVNLVGIKPFRLEKDLMRLFVRELDDLVFDRRTIARPDAFDLPAIER